MFSKLAGMVAGMTMVGVMFACSVFAEGPGLEPPGPITGHSPANIVVGTPFADVGSIADAGVVDLISSRPNDGLLDYTNVVYSQSRGDPDSPKRMISMASR